MGYFPNGSAGMDDEANYCNRCIHKNGPDGDSGCAVYLAHLLKNYDECNDEGSILHMLIPRDVNGNNEQCLMFVEAVSTPAGGSKAVLGRRHP